MGRDIAAHKGWCLKANSYLCEFPLGHANLQAELILMFLRVSQNNVV